MLQKRFQSKTEMGPYGAFTDPRSPIWSTAIRITGTKYLFPFASYKIGDQDDRLLAPQATRYFEPSPRRDLHTRLDAASVHLAKIIEMVAEGRDGLQIAQQMQAVVAAIDKTKTLLVTDHIEHHLEDVIGPLPQVVRGELAKLSELAKYL
jgi:uncharacterized protein